MKTISAAKIYTDTQDPTDTGWSWLVEYTDGHQESGGCESPEDGVREARRERGGSVLPAALEEWTRRDQDGQSYHWSHDG